MANVNAKTRAKWKKMVQNAPLAKYPKPIQDLIKKHGTPYAAGKAMGLSGAGWLNKFAHGRPFDAKSKAIVEAALRGEQVAVAKSNNKRNDPKTAILIMASTTAEQLYNIAQQMGGEWVWKRKAGKDLIGVLKMGAGDLSAFLALATAKGAQSHVT